ncbi:hypothetical protein CBR_g38297 [Chara braunii]|uniref:Uncharacterized protein n=1 Tax=Chara braunii TaxID=69332 RepID=A0A388LPQ1_CHABU|nr:hypothetical protein CBR_g38297 [Chara braunii]|eukprot:GBG84326.1 hypothetical protein CBR_g38297 [Chara braunii]
MRYLQRHVGGAWKGPYHLEVLGDPHEFHKEPTPNEPKRKDTTLWEPDAKANCEKLATTEWWATYGGDVSDLQAIAIKIVIERRKKKVRENEPELRRPLDVVQEREEEHQEQSEAVVKMVEVALQEEGNDKVQPKRQRRRTSKRRRTTNWHKKAEEKDQQENKDNMEQQKEVEMEHEEEDKEMEHEEDEEGMERQGEQEDMEQQEEAEVMDQQDMQHNVDEEDGEEEHQPVVKTVYTCRQRLVVSSQSVEDIPDFPPNNEVVQHDNLWVSRVGRKRKEPMKDAATKPKRAYGRARKLKTVEPVAKPKKKSRQRKARAEVVEDDPDSDNCNLPHSSVVFH